MSEPCTRSVSASFRRNECALTTNRAWMPADAFSTYLLVSYFAGTYWFTYKRRFQIDRWGVAFYCCDPLFSAAFETVVRSVWKCYHVCFNFSSIIDCLSMNTYIIGIIFVSCALYFGFLYFLVSKIIHALLNWKKCALAKKWWKHKALQHNACLLGSCSSTALLKACTLAELCQNALKVHASIIFVRCMPISGFCALLIALLGKFALFALTEKGFLQLL